MAKRLATHLAPAKINLTLHVTDRRADGYHLLDSLVVFAGIGDQVTVEPADTMSLTVTGPMAAGVPTDASNLVIKAATLIGVSAAITLDKHLPNAAGIGGGSSDAAATLRALSLISGKPIPDDTTCLGADVPVCLAATATRMRGIGDDLRALPDLPALHAVLVNPGVPVATAAVFNNLAKRDNPTMPESIPTGMDAATFAKWLTTQRNDLEGPAITATPVIAEVLAALKTTQNCLVSRMSGSGGTCFGLYPDGQSARTAQNRITATHPTWWTQAVLLNDP